MTWRASTVLLSGLALAASSLLWSPAAKADACDWEGGENTAWSNAANWSCGRVPGANDDVSIGGEVEIATSTTVGSLTLKTFGDVSSPSPSQVITVAGDFTWTGGYLGTGVTVRGQTTTEGVDDKIIRGRGRLTTSNMTEGLRVSGTGILLVDTDPGIAGLTSPSALLEEGAHVESSGCCSTIRTWDVTDLRVAGDAYVVDLKTSLGFASVAQGAALNIAGGLLEVKERSTGSTRAFGDTTGYQGGRIIVGAPKPDRESSETTDATLPADLRLGNITWEHRGGTIYTRTKTAVTAPATGTAGTFEWTGGSLAGDVTVGNNGQGVSLSIQGAPGYDMFFLNEGASKVGKLTVAGQGVLHEGTTLMMTTDTTLSVDPSGHIEQDPGSTVTSGSCCSPLPSLINRGTWSTRRGAVPAEIGSVDIKGLGSWKAGLGTIQFSGDAPVTLEQLTVEVDATESGFVSAASSLTIGSLSAEPASGFTSSVGDTYPVAEAPSSRVRSRIVGGPSLSNGLRFQAVSSASGGINLVVVNPVNVAVACSPCRAPFLSDGGQLTFTVELNPASLAPDTKLQLTFTTGSETLIKVNSDGCPRVWSSRVAVCNLTRAQFAASGRSVFIASVIPKFPTESVSAKLTADIPLTGTTSALAKGIQDLLITCVPTSCAASGKVGQPISLNWQVRSPFSGNHVLRVTFDAQPGITFSAPLGWSCRPTRAFACSLSVPAGARQAPIGLRIVAQQPGTFTLSNASSSLGGPRPFTVKIAR